MANNAAIYDVNMLIQAGINPKTGLPIKAEGAKGDGLKTSVKKVLRVIDEQTAINRYKWYNLPEGLTGQMIERILYYKGQGMLFFLESTMQWYFLPYCLDGQIDIYGRFQKVKPLPFNGSTEVKKDDKLSPMARYITQQSRDVLYDIWDPDKPVGSAELAKYCILLSDYSKQISQTNISRQVLNDPLLDVMADCVPFLRTALLNGTGVQGMRVNTESEAANVGLASAAIDNAALTGQKYIPIIGNVDFQGLTEGEVAKAEEYLLAMQSLDNFRLSTYGLDNGGLFQKKSHMLEAEQEMNTGNVGLINQDGLELRKRFCEIWNSIIPLGVSCEVDETVIGLDRNFDGEIGGDDSTSMDMGGSENVQQVE